MSALKNPKWLDKYTFDYKTVDDIPPALYDEINTKLDRLQQGKPVVSLTIAAWNEEVQRVMYFGQLIE